MTAQEDKKVLIAEDDPDAGSLLQLMLRLEGINSVVVGDGAAAAEFLSRETPAVLVTDIDMPKKNGITLIREIRQREGEAAVAAALPIIAMSAGGEDKLRGATKAGAAFGLDKVNMVKIVERVKEFLFGRAAPQRLQFTGLAG